MVVTDEPGLGEGLRRLWRLGWMRKFELAKVFGTGLAVAVLVILPVLLLVFGALHVSGWIYETACGRPLTRLADFVLTVYQALLLWAPVCAVPLVFLNALSLNAYAGLVEGLEPEEEEEPIGVEPESEEGVGSEEADVPAAEDEAPEKPKKSKK
jgi:hypothetical protein